MAGDKKSIIQGFSGFAPAVQNIIRNADQNLKVWELYDMDPMSTWVKNHVALLGDAAHPFQPCMTPTNWSDISTRCPVFRLLMLLADMGQGGAMAIEDAVSIATLLPLGSKAEDIPARLEMYQTSRRPRIDMVLHFTRLNGRREDDKNNVRLSREFIFPSAPGRDFC